MGATVKLSLTRILKLLITTAIICNILALLVVPLAVFDGYAPVFQMEGRASNLYENFRHLIRIFAYDFDDGLGNLAAIYLGNWIMPYSASLNAFLWACGICTAVILWQGRCVVDTVLMGRPFCRANAISMKRAGVCCLIISAAALVRLIWGFCYYRTLQPLLTYNALFVPIFATGFLLCLVMSALFRQAADLKEENDLTI